MDLLQRKRKKVVFFLINCFDIKLDVFVIIIETHLRVSDRDEAGFEWFVCTSS